VPGELSNDKMPQANVRQLIIALDAMEWSLVEQWAAQQKLPTLQRLLKEGTYGPLSSTAAQLPDTVWTSIYTGMNPAKYQKYFYIQYEAATRNLKLLSDDESGATPFWHYLSKAGKRIAILDPPKFPCSDRMNGIQLTNWGAHATKTARSSHPKSLLLEVDRKFGRHPVGDCDCVDSNPAALSGLRERILKGIHVHGEVFRWAMMEHQWDVFFAGFSAAHCVGHHFWHFFDQHHPKHPEKDPYSLEDTIEAAYRAMDEEIGKMLSQAGHDVRLMLVAGHGMGPLYHASWNLMQILEVLGYGPSRDRTSHMPLSAAVNPWRLLKMTLPGKMQYAIKEMLPRRLQNELLFRWYAGSRDWRGWRAFAIPNNDSVGAIRVSVIGRDRDGVVHPGSEYQKVCHELSEALYKLTDPCSGRSIVKAVSISCEQFHGPYLPQLPDITVLWDQSFSWDSIDIPGHGILKLRQQDARTGSHTPQGFFIIHGPDVPPGRSLAGYSTYDIAPSILETARVSIPEDMDGRPIVFQ